jgi:hypothetical protein
MPLQDAQKEEVPQASIRQAVFRGTQRIAATARARKTTHAEKTTLTKDDTWLI